MIYHEMPMWTTLIDIWPEWSHYHTYRQYYWATKINERAFGVFAIGEVEIPILDDPLPPKVGLYEIFPGGWDWGHPVYEMNEASLDDAIISARYIRERVMTLLLMKVL